MARKNDPSIAVFGAGVLLKHLGALKQEIDGVRAAQDIEYIHRMRVATRRTRSALDLFASIQPARRIERWTEQVRGITRALGAARDLDVQIERLQKFYAALTDLRQKPGIRRLLLRLGQRRSKAQARVLSALEELQASGVLEEMDEKLSPLAAATGQVYLFTPALYQLAFNTLSQKLDEFLSFELFIENPERVAELHEMRIAAKHLRYALEAFAPLYGESARVPLQAIRQAQESLGDIHDCDVWSTALPGLIEKERERTEAYFGSARPMLRLMPGLNAFLEDRLAAREKAYRRFLKDWAEMRAQGVWSDLRQAIQVPFNLSEAFDVLAAARTSLIDVPDSD